MHFILQVKMDVYIEGTKMVLVCHGGSSKPEKMYLG
jgi:hypothetical protein